MTRNDIRVAIVGIGDVASALVQGVENYKQNPDKMIGILPEITQYSIHDINFVLGIDVNSNKVGKDLSEAIFAEPNCNMRLFNPRILNAPVIKGPIMDGLDSNIKNIIPVEETQKPADIMKELKNNNVDVTIILLPTGAHDAVKFYAMNALEAGSCVVNGMPSPVVHDPDIVVLDEPHTGLDPTARKMVRKLILKLSDMGKTIFLSSHLLFEVSEVADRVAMINYGEIVACDTLDRLEAMAKKSEIEL